MPWQPALSTLMTPWGEKLTPYNAWREYPRPALARAHWMNLNGLWDYAIGPASAPEPSQWGGKILVPFALEAPLSGVGRMLEPTQALWYRLQLQLKPKPGSRLMLNFEAVDYECLVFVNEVLIGRHVGGFTPFSFDISAAAKAGENTIAVKVTDATGGAQLKGKQDLHPKGIMYTRSSGIWQTVWLEELPDRHIERLESSWNEPTLTLKGILGGSIQPGDQLRAKLSFQGKSVAEAAGGDLLCFPVPEAQLWAPSHPHLYDLEIELLNSDGQVIDKVNSYVGLRTVGRMRDEQGHWRFTLNGQPIFHWGPLDQGWWPDGLLTPPSEQAMRFDIRFLKEAGFNMIRKHIKIEPRLYYYECDKLGMLVWQDQVCGGQSPKWTTLQPDPEDAQWEEHDHQQWLSEYFGMIELLGNHPSIVVWTPFNEAWGQHRTMEVGRLAVERDPSRLINIASGGNWWPVGHIADRHNYPSPDFPVDDPRFGDYIKVVGEFGGLGFPVEGHLHDVHAHNWGYGGLKTSSKEWPILYAKLIGELAALKERGVAAGVYTQTTDVEGEVNGLLTYDRKVAKIDADTLALIHELLGN